MSNRILPYGYRIQNGKLTVDKMEAEIVKEIYSKRTNGEILSKIADNLNLRGILFYEDAGWDKHKVKRVLENDRYTGKDGYPPILDEKEVRLARSYQYRTSPENICPAEIQKLKKVMFCENCGTKIFRTYVKRRTSNPIGWKCHTCGMNILIRDNELLDIILKSHRRLKKGLLGKEPDSPFPIPSSPESRLLENQISTLFSRTERNDDEIRQLIMQWTAQRYEDTKTVLQDHTERVKGLLEENDEALTESIVSIIALNVPHIITVRYINGIKIITGKENGDDNTGEECYDDTGKATTKR